MGFYFTICEFLRFSTVSAILHSHNKYLLYKKNIWVLYYMWSLIWKIHISLLSEPFLCVATMNFFINNSFDVTKKFDFLDVVDSYSFSKSIMEFLIIIHVCKYYTLGYLWVKCEYPHVKCSTFFEEVLFLVSWKLVSATVTLSWFWW